MSKYDREHLRRMARQVMATPIHDSKLRQFYAELTKATGLTRSQMSVKVAELIL